MRHVIERLIWCVAFILTLSSCASSSQFVINGNPGEQIYTPEGKQLGTVPNSGQLELKMESYDAFLLSRNPQTGQVVPFGLDYKFKSGRTKHTVTKIGCTLFWGGVSASMLGGLGILLVGESSTMSMIAGAGLIGMGSSVFLMMPSLGRNSMDEYQFEFLKQQRTNSDLIIQGLMKPNIAETKEAKPLKLRPTKDESMASPGDFASVQNNAPTQKAKFKLGGNAKKIEGAYVGMGVISLRDKELETLKDMKLRVQTVDATHVEISFLESNGNDFFGMPVRYMVEKAADNTYKLTNVSLPQNIIRITNNGEMMYDNPRVEIEGDIYRFKISAEIQ